jgi:hypothetical protein
MSTGRDISRPAFRKLRVYSFDPSLRQSLQTATVNSVTIAIPWEKHPDNRNKDGPAIGPVGEYIEVIDYDPASDCFYAPVDLNNPYILAQHGLTPSDGDPQFHQQMVYAVAMKTIKNFEYALGRLVLWAPRKYRDDNGTWHNDYVRRLRIYPHALREANAYYSPDRKAILFGYTRATRKISGEHFPGGLVFTCLSHDIIVHEMTHALLDGLHPYFDESSNPDVLAFHEAFADIVALFQHFSFPDVVRHQIASTGGILRDNNLLVDLARQFGRAVGHSGALRSAIGKDPSEVNLSEVLEPHDRGAILMAAIFDAFLAIYNKRTADLIRLATGGSGLLEEGAALHPDLVDRLAREASKAADHVMRMCIRALDYLPPVDITFGDYLRALITADRDTVPDDAYDYRVAFIESFRRFSIFPEDVRSLSEESLLWKPPSPELAEMPFIREIQNLVRGWDLSIDRKVLYDQMEAAREQTHEIFKQSGYKQARLEGIIDLLEHKFEVHSIRPVRRVGPGGQLLIDLLVEITQSRPGSLTGAEFPAWPNESAHAKYDFRFRGGCTLIIDMKTANIRYCIPKYIDDLNRYQRQQTYRNGEMGDGSFRATYFGDYDKKDDDNVYAMLHRSIERKG